MVLPDITLLQAAIVVAEELHFGRAADKLNMTQPTLSKQIFRLERSVALRLFEHNHQAVELTPAGQVFIAEAREVVFHAERAILSARAVVNGSTEILNVGKSSYTDPFYVSLLGELSKAKDNVVLVPTWASGTSEQWIPLIGPGKLVDSSKYFVVVVDAFANGVSSSPSNSARQPRMGFPVITIHDMVVSQYRLLTEELHLVHLHAVLGQSMGGMQALEWAVSYPDWMDRVVTIVGAPKIANYDRIVWHAQLAAVRADPAWNGGNYRENPAVTARAYFSSILLTSPEMVNRQNPGGELTASEIATARAVDANDFIRQIEAVETHDISRHMGGSMEAAAKAIHAKVLVVASRQDRLVTPQPAIDFAKTLGGEAVVLDTPCGHLAVGCEIGKATSVVNEFLR